MADIFDSIQPDTKDIFDQISSETKPIPDVYGGQYGEDISKSFGDIDVSRFGKQLYNVAIATPAHELGKAEMDAADIRAYELTKQYEKEKSIKLQDTLFDQQLQDWSAQLRLPPEQRESTYLKNEPQFKPNEDINPFAAEVAEASGFLDKAQDVIAGVVGFAAQIAILKRAFPMASEAAIWEAQSLATGNPPGKGAATLAAFSVPGKVIPGKTTLGKTGQVVGESATLAGITALEGGTAEDILVSAGIPIALRTPGLIKSIGTKSPKLAETISTQPDFLAVPGGTTQVRPGRRDWQAKWGGNNETNLKNKMLDLLAQAEKIEQANPVNKDALLNRLADQMVILDKQITKLKPLWGRNLPDLPLSELHKLARNNGVDVPKGTTKTGLIRLLKGNEDIIETEGGFKVRNLSGDTSWESTTYSKYEDAVEALQGQEIGVTQPKGGLNDALVTATETLSLAPKGETQGWLGKILNKILGSSEVQKISDDFGVNPNYVIGNIQVEEISRRMISRYPQKITDQKSAENFANKVFRDMGVGAWGIKVKLVDKIPGGKRILGKADINNPLDFTPGPRGGTLWLVRPGTTKIKNYNVTQGSAKKTLIHEIVHFIEPGTRYESGRIIVHTPEFKKRVEQENRRLFVEKKRYTPVSEVPERARSAEYPPGTNVYRTKSGRVITEIPGGKKEDQTTIMRDGKVYEKSTGEELTIDTELSPGGIDRLSIAPEEKPVGRRKPKRRPKPGTKIKREPKPRQEKSAVDIFREWRPKAVKISKTVWEKTKRETLARKAASAVRYIKWLEGRGIPHNEAVRMSKAKLKGKVRRPEFEPPQMSDAQWLGLSERAEQVYKNDYFKQLDVQEALDKLRWEGRIPTPGEFISLEPVLGKDVVDRMIEGLKETKQYTWYDAPVLIRDGLKSRFGFDPQTPRQLSGAAPRHPIRYIKVNIVTLRTIVSKKAAKKVTEQIENNPLFQQADEWGLNLLAVNPWAKGIEKRLEQMGEFSRYLATRKPKITKAWGRYLERVERGANLGINTYMLDELAVANKKLQLFKDKKGWNEEQIAKFKKERGQAINVLAKRLIAKNPKLRHIQTAANWVLFSPAWAVVRPYKDYLTIKQMITSSGNRTFLLQHTLAQIAAIGGISTIIATIAHKRRLQNPTEEPIFDSSSDPTDSNWGKFRWKNDVYDFSMGDSSWYRLLARIGVSAYVFGKELSTGKQVTKIGGKPVPSAGEEIWKYAQSRETVWLGLAKVLTTGKDWMGNSLDNEEKTWELVKGLIPADFFVSMIESGNADGLWESLSQGDIKEASKDFVRNIPTGLIGLAGAGTTTYPVSPNATRADYRNIIAQDFYKKNWEDLTPIEQRKLTVANREDFKILDQKVAEYRVENPYDVSKIQEEERQAGERIRGRLTKENQLMLSGVSLGLNRSPGKFYLNDERYNQYQDYIVEILNERLSKFKQTPNKKVLETVVSASKSRAAAMLRREMR